MGAGSSAEQRSPQDGAIAAGESQSTSPERETPTAEVAEPEQPEDSAKLLQKNGQISSINGITEEQVELSLKSEELKKEQGEAVITDVGQRETANVILKEESSENMETKPQEFTNKTNVDDEQKDTQDADEQLPLSEEKVEEQTQPCESPSSNDVGFKKVFKFVGFKFTVRKDKTEKAEPVQLLNVKADATELVSEGAGDCKEIKIDTVEEETQNETPYPIEKTEQETQTEQTKEVASPEKIPECPVEAGSKEAEIKSDGSKSPESPTSPLTSETASPLRKFFTQGWAGFRKKTSFRKPKEEQQAIEKEKEEQEKEVIKEETGLREELEKEKPIPEKERQEVFVQASNAKVEREGRKMVDAAIETHKKEAVAPCEQTPSQLSAGSVDKGSEISLNKIDLEEKVDPVQECLMAIEQSTLASCEEKTLATEVFEEKIDQSEPTSPMAIEIPEEHFEIVEVISESKAPVAVEYFDERPTEINTDVSIIVKKEEPKIEKGELVLVQLVETNAEIQRGQSIDEQLKVKETLPELVNKQLKQIKTSSGDSATMKSPEVITNEVELLSSQERAKVQGSPLKKLFTGTNLKKLSGKKHKGKREEAKLEEAEQIQQLSDSAESPEDPRAESSASSPEEATESVEKVIDAAQTTETEEGFISDIEKKRESVTPWASFKKMVTPKKRVRRLSESDKEEELDKVKSATLSSTESAPCEEQEGEEQKFEKSTDEPKRKVDTSVSWEALICVGSSKKRTRKSSSSDEEVGQRLAQEGQKIEESGPHKETAQNMTISSSQESDQGQGSSSPEQAGSPSEGDGVSTWESFKRLVTPRRKSKTKMEERNEESATVPSLEHSTSDGDSGKEESWVSFKKLMPTRRKKKSDGISEHAPVQEAGEETSETNEDDSDVPAVVPLSEYEAAEQEKLEAQKAKQDDMTKKTSDQKTEKPGSTSVTEQSNEGLVHAVTVTMVKGERAVTSIEERSPSWISAAMTESIEHANEAEEKPVEQISETGTVEEKVVVTKLMPEIRKDISGDTIISEVELTSEAVTAREETSSVEATEISCAEETTEMVSAVSRLTESPDTTEIATPVQEVEESQQNLEELNKQTQENLKEVAERVKLSSEAQQISKRVTQVIIQPVSVEKTGQETTVIFQEAELAEPPLKEEEHEKTDTEIKEGIESSHGQDEVKESSLKKVFEKSNDMCVKVKESSKEIANLDRADESRDPKIKQEIIEVHEKIIEEQMMEDEFEEEEFVIVTVTPEEEPEVNVGDIVLEVKTNLEETVEGRIKDVAVPAMDRLARTTCDEKPQFSQKLEQLVNIIPDLESELEHTETIAVEVKAPLQNEIKDAEPPYTEVFVLEASTESKVTEVPVQNAVAEVSDLDIAKHATLDLRTGSTEDAVVEACIQNKDSEVSVETHMQKVEPEGQLPKLEMKISVVNEKPEFFLLNTETQNPTETVEKDLPTRKVEVHNQNVETEAHKQVMETNSHVEEVEMKTCIQSVGAEVLAEKAELKVDMELPTEKAKVMSSSEKADVEVHMKETEVQIFAEKAQAKLEAYTEKVDVKEDVEKVESEITKTKVEMETSIQKVESEAPTEIMEVESPLRRTEAEAPAEQTNTTVLVETITNKAEAKVEAEVPAEKAETAAPSDQADENLDEESPAEKFGVESHAEKTDAEIVKKKTEVEVPAKKVDVEDSTKEAKVESSIKKGETNVVTETAEVEAPIENTETKAGVEVFTEKVRAKAEMKTPAEKMAKEVSSEQSEEMVEAEAIISKHPELKENLQDVENEVSFQSHMEDTSSSLATCVEVISEQISVDSDKTEVPAQREMQDVSLSLELQCTEGIAVEAPENNELKNVTLVESKCTKGSVSWTVVQKEIHTSPIKTEVETLKCMGNTAAQDHVQNEMEDAVTLESKYTEAEITQDTVKNEVDSVKKEIGNIELAIERKSAGTVATEALKARVEENILISDSGCIKSIVSDAFLKNKGDSTLSDLESEGREAGLSGISVQTEACPPDKLPLEIALPLSESTAVSDSCLRRQPLSDKVLIMETETSAEKIELAGGEILNVAPVQQEIFTEHQDTTDIPEVQSYEAQKCSLAVTAVTVEEQVIAENVTVTEISAENLQSLLEVPQEMVFKTVQPVSCAHSGLGALGPDMEAVLPSGKADSVVENTVLPAVTCTKDDLIQKCAFDSIPEMKLQKLESSQEGEKKATPPERSPSLTHVEFQKDVVQSVMMESQSTKIVLKIIQNAVDKLEETEELPSTSKQQSESCLKGVSKSEIQEDLQTIKLLYEKSKEEKNQEILPSTLILGQSAENQDAFRMAEEMCLTSGKSEDGNIWGSRKSDAKLKPVKFMSHPNEQSCTMTTLVQVPGSLNEVVKEIKETDLQKENGEPKLQSEVDTAAPTKTKRATVEDAVSGNLLKSLEVSHPKLKNVEVGQTVQIQQQLIEQQTHVKKEDHSQLTGFVETHTEKDVNNKDYTTCESPQLKSELTES
ncbi:A-kinase anchor protein 12 [Rhineura floridana]|uniref:A-kinase anchor protein 12 n=1 Tax=Rhineura floridana TaxID=261503 RepID=UPI002AC84CF8|nr:A-kinase anchor protein 12 [Rhineura floridana]